MGLSFKLSKYHLMDDIFNNIENKTEEELLRLLLLPKKEFPNGYDLVEKEFKRRNKNIEEILKEKHKEQGEIKFVFKKVNRDDDRDGWGGNLLFSNKAIYYYPLKVARAFPYWMQAPYGPVPFGFYKDFFFLFNYKIGLEPKEIEMKNTYNPKEDLLSLSLICKHIYGAFAFKKSDVMKIFIRKNGRVDFWMLDEKAVQNVRIKKGDIPNFKTAMAELGYPIENNISFREYWKKYSEYYGHKS